MRNQHTGARRFDPSDRNSFGLALRTVLHPTAADRVGILYFDLFCRFMVFVKVCWEIGRL